MSIMERWQYPAAKIVVNTKSNIPGSAIFLEIGCEPATAFMTGENVACFQGWSIYRMTECVILSLMKWLEKMKMFGILCPRDACISYVGLDNFNFQYGNITRESLLLDVTQLE